MEADPHEACRGCILLCSEPLHTMEERTLLIFNHLKALPFSRLYLGFTVLSLAWSLSPEKTSTCQARS